MEREVKSTANAGGHELESAAQQFLTFQIAEELFAIPILSVKEIRGWEPVCKIPNAPAHVMGVINLRGEVVPVLDVRSRLSIARTEKTSTTVVIVVRVSTAGGSTSTVGCVVDAVSDVANIPTANIRPPPAVCGVVAAQFVQGVSNLERQLVMLLDLPQLVAADGTSGAVAA
jgi:purine-binding chemotaxis protein CheW